MVKDKQKTATKYGKKNERLMSIDFDNKTTWWWKIYKNKNKNI